MNGLGACEPRPLGPEESLSRFLSDIRYGRVEPAFAALCPDSQTLLRERHQALAPGRNDAPEAEILFQELGLEVLHVPESLHVASPIGETVTLRVSVRGGQSANVYLKRESGHWCVDLTRTLGPERSKPPKPYLDETPIDPTPSSSGG